MNCIQLYVNLILLFVCGCMFGTILCRYSQNLKSLQTVQIPLQVHQIQILSVEPRILLIPQFLTDTECAGLIQLAEPRLQRSTVQGVSLELSGDRTSYSANLLPAETTLVKEIESRALLLSPYPASHTEPLQVVRYLPDQFYKPHFDFFVPSAKGTPEALRRGGQRIFTYFVYLNDLLAEDQGGSTIFPKLGLKVKPQRGSALFFVNKVPGLEEDFRLLHGGEPPEHSTKYGLNIWIREKPFH